MYVEVTVGQWDYLFRTSRTYFGLELMAIVFSLPWALLMWSCVIASSRAFPPFFYGITDTPDRMLTFYAALFCYCWSIPKHESRITIVSVSGVLFPFFLACILTIWAVSDKWSLWLDSLPSPIARALRTLHLSRLRDAVVSFRGRFHSYPRNDVGSEHEFADRQDGVVDGV